LEEFDFEHARGLKRDVIAQLGILDFVPAREKVVFLALPACGADPPEAFPKPDEPAMTMPFWPCGTY
jgi:hypothetical protein